MSHEPKRVDPFARPPRRTFRQFLWDEGFTFGFQFPGTFKKFPELIPITGIFLLSLSWAVINIYHGLTSKTDVRFNKYKRNVLPEDDIGPTQKTKWYTRNPEVYRPIPELEAMKGTLKLEDEDEDSC